MTSKLKLSEDFEARLEENLSTAQYALSTSGELLKSQTIDGGLPADDEKRKSAFDILEIFVRINTQGMTLRRSDLIVSMLRLYWPDASNLLPAFIKEINESSNLNIDTDFVIRCMFSTAGLGTRLDFDLLRRKSNVEALKATYASCFEAIRSAVDFCRNDCGVDSAKLLSGVSTSYFSSIFCFILPVMRSRSLTLLTPNGQCSYLRWRDPSDSTQKVGLGPSSRITFPQGRRSRPVQGFHSSRL